jgi:hypothetical protein
MKYFNEILFVVALVAWIGWVLTRRYFNLNPDLDRHKTSEPPTDAQIRWHIWNMRKDISMIAVTNFAILLVMIYAFILKL